MTTNFKIGAAQFYEFKGDFKVSISRHEAFIEQAALLQVDVLVFPELSLSGYEPKLVSDIAFSTTDTRLHAFQNLCEKYAIILCIGAPIRRNHGVEICMVIYRPNKPMFFYPKSLLHPNEYSFFVEGKQDFHFEALNQLISPAICFESFQPEHLQKVRDRKSTLYICSVAKHKKGVEEALPFFAEFSNSANCISVMSNSVGQNSDFHCAGNSTIWNANGKVAAQLNSHGEGLAVYDTVTQQATIIQF